MQLMGMSSTENGLNDGLKFIEGEVKIFDKENLKIPHVGFNQVKTNKNTRLYEGLSNDPDFEQSSTVQIQNFPSGTYDASTDYICNLNPLHFFDSSQSIESSRSSQSGTGLFIVNNWALSANGGLSKVYMKAIITGPAGEDAEYPRGFGLFDTIVWEGSFPVKPEYSEYSSLKSGWIGKNSLCLFKSGSASGAQINSSGVSRYVGSVYEIASIGNTANLHSINSSFLRTECPKTVNNSEKSLTRVYFGSLKTIASTIITFKGLHPDFLHTNSQLF